MRLEAFQVGRLRIDSQMQLAIGVFALTYLESATYPQLCIVDLVILH